MSMSDCLYCWDTPCTCGADYREWSIEALDKRIALFERVKKIKMAKPELCQDAKKFIAEMERLEKTAQ